jgi:hypothetical protein
VTSGANQTAGVGGSLCDETENVARRISAQAHRD